MELSGTEPPEIRQKLRISLRRFKRAGPPSEVPSEPRSAFRQYFGDREAFGGRFWTLPWSGGRIEYGGPARFPGGGKYSRASRFHRGTSSFGRSKLRHFAVRENGCFIGVGGGLFPPLPTCNPVKRENAKGSHTAPNLRTFSTILHIFDYYLLTAKILTNEEMAVNVKKSARSRFSGLWRIR